MIFVYPDGTSVMSDDYDTFVYESPVADMARIMFYPTMVAYDAVSSGIKWLIDDWNNA